MTFPKSKVVYGKPEPVKAAPPKATPATPATPAKKAEPAKEDEKDVAEATRLGWNKDEKGEYAHAGAKAKFKSAKEAVAADVKERPFFGVNR